MTRRLAAVVLLVLPLLGACGSTRLYVAQPGPYDTIPVAWKEDLTLARTAFEHGRPREAHRILRRYAVEQPELLPIRVFLQEVELALLEAGEVVGGFAVADSSKAAASLGDVYRDAADAQPGAARYVLAARLATEASVALALLDQARAEDSRCVWVHYAIAWWNTRQRLYPAARASVADAFELDGGHLPTMRLHATHLAGAGEIRPAIDCLRAWLARTELSPLVAPSVRAEAYIDLAALYLLQEEPAKALDLVSAIDRADLVHPARAELVRAAALDELDESSLALSAARRARDLAPDSSLALVYQALLLEVQGNHLQERQTWELLLAETEAIEKEADDDPLDFSELLIRLRARARLATLERELGTPSLGSTP